jgi:hypothetical protein
MTGLLADLVAVVHLSAVLFLLSGALLALRRPRLLLPHLLVAGAILAVNLAGAACPLTELEVWLRGQAGEPAYGGGFIEHYLIEPWHPAGITPAVSVGIYAVAVVPNLVGYGLHAARRRPTVRA